MNEAHRILYCDCAEAAAVSTQTKVEVRRALGESGRHVDAVPDLCALAARKDPRLAELAGASHLVVAACHPRAVKWLFAAGGAPLQDEHVTYLDMRDGSADEHRHAIRALAGDRVALTGGALPTPPETTSALASGPTTSSSWKPWFPVIDFDRCNTCRQCVGFCLFGVYGVGPNGAVQVKHPARCKTGCPACARLCPTEAIIFPKYASAPINGGDTLTGAAPQEPIRVDRVALLGSDPLAALRDRNKRDLLMSLPPDQLLAVRERFAHLASARGRANPAAADVPSDAPNEPT